MSRYDGRYWRGYYADETGLLSDFGNAVKGRNGNEAWFATDKGVDVMADFPTDTWVPTRGTLRLLESVLLC
jgi:hypothetical protein